MRSRRACVIIGLLVLSLSTALSFAQPPTAQQIDDAVMQLGDPSPQVREQAAKLLLDAGDAADAALRAASRGDDPEVAARAREILRRAAPSPTASPAPETDAAARYRSAGIAARRRMVTELSNQREFASLARLWGVEADAQVRAAIFQELLKDPAASAGAFLADGNVATAELLLEAAVEGNAQDAAHSYAAYFLCRGKIDEALARWAARGGKQPPDPGAQEVLATLHRARGDSDAARKFAEAADDSALLDEVLLTAGDWPRLAAEMRRQVTTPRIARNLTPLAACDHFAGDEAAFAGDLAQITKLARVANDTHLAANTMLLCDRPDDALRLMTSVGLWGPAYEVLIARGQYDEAAALLAQHDADTTDDAAWLRCSAARAYAQLGEKKKCLGLIARVEKDNAAVGAPRIYAFLADAERAAGMEDKAWNHYFAAVSALPRRMDKRWYVGRAFSADEHEVDWADAWRIMTELTVTPRRQDFDQLRKAADGTLPLEELLKLTDTVDLSNDDVQAWSGVVWEAARRLRQAGQEDRAAALLEKSAQAAKSGDLYVRRGDLAAEKKDWPRAADCYERGWQKDRLKALPLYLQGWALQRGGRVAAGRERIELAHLLPLGDESQRLELMKGLTSRGLDDAAAREADVLLRTGTSLSAAGEAASRVAAERAIRQGDFAAAYPMLQRLLLHFATGSLWLREEYSYLFLPNTARRTHARALLAAGDLAGAKREMDACAELMPDEITTAIELIPDLEKHGYKQEADALFARALARQQALCARFPDSANHHNQLAWLAAECKRELDTALTHAKRAVELDPNHAAYIDTLAETYFQRGEIDEAIVQMKKCVALQPDVRRNRTQLAKYEAAKEKR
jgi:tetratricopeptide (TPR) repeat protein